MFIDTHAHLCSDELWNDADDILKRAFAANILRIFVIVTNKKELQRAFDLKRRYPESIAIIASTTPHEALSSVDPFYEEVKAAANATELAAIGETGLEYFHKGLNIERQKQYLIHYFALAKEHHLPVVFHCREAFSDLFELADKHYTNSKAILHCFTGSKEEAKEVIKRGWLLSISGIATYKKSESIREIIKEVPIENLVVETDCPYLAPQSKRGKVNEPSYILETYELIANLKDITVKEVAEKIFINADKFFSF